MSDQTAYDVILEFLRNDEHLYLRDRGTCTWCIDGTVRIDLLAEKIESWAIRLTEYQKSMIANRESEDRAKRPKP